MLAGTTKRIGLPIPILCLVTWRYGNLILYTQLYVFIS